jgi:hypothetical protein
MLRAALRLLGIESDATTLAGLSGSAFRTYWRCADDDPRSAALWDPDVPLVCAFDPLATAAESFGWRLLWYRNAPGHVAFQFAMQSIGRGHPVLSYGFVGEPEDVLIVGCDRSDELRILLVLTRHASDPIAFELPDGPWPGGDARGICVGLFDRVPPRLQRPPEIDAQRALRRAVWLAHQRGLRSRGFFRSGHAAYTAWIDALIDPGPAFGAWEAAERIERSYGLSLPEDPEERAMIGIRHILNRSLAELAQARDGAARFVRSQSGLYETGEAATAFEHEAMALAEAAALWPAVVEGGASAFRLADSPDGLEAPFRREETARCLRIAAAAHITAIDAIERHVPPTEQERAGEEEEEEEA